MDLSFTIAPITCFHSTLSSNGIEPLVPCSRPPHVHIVAPPPPYAVQCVDSHTFATFVVKVVVGPLTRHFANSFLICKKTSTISSAIETFHIIEYLFPLRPFVCCVCCALSSSNRKSVVQKKTKDDTHLQANTKGHGMIVVAAQSPLIRRVMIELTRVAPCTT